MLTAAEVKRVARELGADLCGIASMDRFDGAPKQQDPRYIFPDAKAAIVLAFRIPRGYMRGIEEGTYFASYTGMGYGHMNNVYMPGVMRELCCFLEDEGYEGVPIPNMYIGASISFPRQAETPERSRSVREGLPFPDVMPDFRIMAFAAGMGEFGYSKVFLTPEFGPMQRFVAILTDAELEPDPLFEGKICDRCMSCVRECSGKAISATETESIVVAGRKIEWGKLDIVKCSIAYRGGNPDYNPFFQPTHKPEDFHGYTGGPAMDKAMEYGRIEGHNPALEGARGCFRACLAHLEAKGVLKKTFKNPFRKRTPWKLPPLGSDGWQGVLAKDSAQLTDKE
ncbi:MAG TPA: (4Fe-4S)-binding protein [Lentisphaeria bacterium]|nr:(4Fe-4S)-binding protein [Lentisphaeria bacterium]